MSSAGQKSKNMSRKHKKTQSLVLVRNLDKEGLQRNNPASAFRIQKFNAIFALSLAETILDLGCWWWTGGIRHIERRLLRSGFDASKLRNFLICKSKTRQRWISLGCIYVQLSLCQGHWCTRTPMATLGTAGLLVYLQRGAFSCCSFRLTRYAKTSMRGASDSEGLHAFFVSLY